MNLIELIAYMPATLHKEPTLSPCELLQRGDSIDEINNVSLQDLVHFFATHEDCVDMWLQYSADQRTDETWYFKRLKDGRFEVGYTNKGTITSKKIFARANVACATYVRNEIEDIKNICIASKKI